MESLFIAFRLTGDLRYRQYGWKIFQSIEKHCRVKTGGFASILNVEDVNSKLEDRMETFLMVRTTTSTRHSVPVAQVICSRQSETLKYLYLLFADATVLPLHGTLEILISLHGG